MYLLFVMFPADAPVASLVRLACALTLACDERSFEPRGPAWKQL
jgi:hypothetical protein